MPLALWDFDGTLAIRPGLWSQTMVEVLDRHRPGHGLTREAFRPAMREGFPWHRPDEPHPHLNDPDRWWDQVDQRFRAGYAAAGFVAEAAELAADVRDVYLEPAAWTVYEDVEPALRRLNDAGWRHVIVSNHVPELAQLVDDLGLANHFDAVFTSALVGYEKPRPEIFRAALDDRDNDRVVMIGDNPKADVEGAAALGMEAYLVRRAHERHRHHDDLFDLARHLMQPPGPP